MKLNFIIIFCSILISSSCAATTSNAVVPATFHDAVTRMIKSNLPDAAVGVTVQDVVTGNILYDYNGSKHFLPASTTKLFTAAAALKLLGPDYRYDTDLYYNAAALKNGIHQGDIALKFTGDPSLHLASLHSLLQKLRDAHIHTITGDVIIDDTTFAGPMLALGWTWDSTPWHHAAPVAAIIIDRNQFGVTLFPVPNVGAKVAAKLDQEYPGSKFRTLVSDIHAVTFEDSENLCQFTAVVDEKNNVELGGCWPLGTQPVHLRLAVKNPRLQAQQFIVEALDKLHITVAGKIKFAPLPNNVTRLAHHASEPLAVLLRPILSESNNLYAESLTKTLGAKLYGVGSFKTGSHAVQKVLTDTTGIDFSQMRMQDGSGESRYNLISPMHLSRLLYAMQRDAKVGSHFRNALAMSGMSGSLQNRFMLHSITKVQAKTGTLNGVSTLAGYFTTRSNHELIITIMINHALESPVLLKQFEEELCDYLISQL